MTVRDDSILDSDLVQAAQKGDKRAFETLVERHFALAYTIAYARLGRAETAEDLAQEVFLRAFLYLDTLKAPFRFAPWVSQIARRLALDWQKAGVRASRLARVASLDALPYELADRSAKDARKALEDREETKAVREAILLLPAEQREVVMLRHFEGLRPAEIAERLGTHRTSVWRHLKELTKP